MKKTLFILFLTPNLLFGQTIININGNFESYNSSASCNNSGISNATNWLGIKNTYTLGNCVSAGNNAVAANTGSQYEPNFYSTSNGAPCPNTNNAGPLDGVGFAYIEFQGSLSGSTTGRNEYIYRQLPISPLQGTSVTYGVSFNTLGTWTFYPNFPNSSLVQIWLVPVPIGTTNIPAAICNHINTASYPSLTTGKGAGGWSQVRRTQTINTSQVNYYLVVGSFFCIDVNSTYKSAIDNVFFTVN